ncbi:MAG: ribosomal protein S18-alanine N-acetyltransferase [Holosporaceae bacterium]|jgi:ribosomal-protein-alanine N-acetyltransferase|nr:ribosomal protein S18-alanine N-acetyltransferase [Holosporaceae bacterium]
MIRKISSVDSQLLAEIHKRCFDDGWDAKTFADMLSKNVFFGFLDLEKTARGFIVGKMVMEEIEIITFCVLPEFRNRGLGKMLINEVDKHAQSNCVEKIFLEVAENNAVAKKIYENSGYAEISRRREYYCMKEGGVDALVMQKIIF